MKLLAVSVLLVGLLASALPVAGQTPPAAAPEPATWYFQNREIATLHAMRGFFTPRDRVNATSQRLRDALKTADSHEVKVDFIEGAYVVTMGSTPLVSILPGDISQDFEGQGATAKAAAEETARKLREAVQAWSDQRRFDVIARGILHSLIAVAIAGLALWLLRRVSVAAIQKLSDTARHKVEGRAVGSINIIDPLMRFLQFLAGMGRAGALAVIVYAWLTYSFSQFPLTAPWASGLAGFIGGALTKLATGILWGIPTLAFAMLILFVTRVFATMVHTMFDAIAQGRLKIRGVYPDTAEAMRRIAVVLVWLFGIAMAFPFIPGSDSDALRGISVLFGLMITLGSSGVISQAMSGLVVVFSRAIKENEYVRVAQYEGTITQVGALSAKLRTPRNEEITIPNSVLLSSATHNYSRLTDANGVVIYATVGIGYDAPWREVHEALLEAARKTPGLKETPSPYVRQAALSAFCVEYTINAYLDRPEKRFAVLSDLHANIQDACNEREIQIMTPAFESQPDERIFVPKSKWFPGAKRPPAA